MPDTKPDNRIELAGDRTRLAHLRTSLALDRTTLAWIRTSLTFATFGLGMIGFFRSLAQSEHSERATHLHAVAVNVGTALVAIGLLALILVAIGHSRALASLRRGEVPGVPAVPLAVAIAVLVALLCLYALWVSLH